MESRFLLTRRGCPHCNNAIKVINKINMCLPLDKQIKIIDCYLWEEFGLRNIHLLEIVDKMEFDGYPFLFVDGVKIEPCPTHEQLKRLLLKRFNKELII